MADTDINIILIRKKRIGRKLLLSAYSKYILKRLRKIHASVTLLFTPLSSNFLTIAQVARIAKPWYNILVFVQFFVNCRAPDSCFLIGKGLLDMRNALWCRQ